MVIACAEGIKLLPSKHNPPGSGNRNSEKDFYPPVLPKKDIGFHLSEDSPKYRTKPKNPSEGSGMVY